MSQDSDEIKSERHGVITAVEGLINQDRVVSFSDAVFAFAATLLVLKIDLPIQSAEQINSQLPVIISQLWPSYLANIISFLVIGYYWLNHHALFSLVKRFNSTIVWLNIVFLICLSFLPFPVDLYGDYPNVKIVLAFYSASLALVGFSLAFIWMYAVNKKLVSGELGQRHLRYYTLRMLLAPIVFSLAVPLSFVHPLLAQLSWLFVVIGVVVINSVYKYKTPSQIEKLIS